MVNLKFTTVTELKQRTSEFVSEAERTGRQFIITKNGIPVAVLQRVTEEELSLDKPKRMEGNK
jgi:prevent-host-death family protein